MAKPSINQIRSLPNWAEMNRWTTRFEKFPNALTGLNSNDYDLRCESVEIPKQTQQNFEVNIRGHKVKQNGLPQYTNVINLVYSETVDNKISQLANSWKEATWNSETGVSNSKADLQAILTVERLNHLDVAIYRYVLYGVLYEDFDGGTLDSATSDALKLTLTLSYDYFREFSL